MTDLHFIPRINLVTWSTGHERRTAGRDRRREQFVPPPAARVPVVERLLARRQRSDGATSDGRAFAHAVVPHADVLPASTVSTGAGGGSPMVPTRSVPRVVHRPPAAATERSPAPLGAWTEVPAVTTPAAWHRSGIAAPAAGAGDFDVDLLTERVMRALDRRVIAQRERTGRR